MDAAMSLALLSVRYTDTNFPTLLGGGVKR